MRFRAPRGEGRSSLSLRNTMWERELNRGIMELLDVWSLALRSFNLLDFNNLDTVRLCTMASTHVTVGLRHCSGFGHITILSVHVVVAGTRVVAQPDTEILHIARIFLKDLQK